MHIHMDSIVRKHTADYLRQENVDRRRRLREDMMWHYREQAMELLPGEYRALRARTALSDQENNAGRSRLPQRPKFESSGRPCDPKKKHSHWNTRSDRKVKSDIQHAPSHRAYRLKV